MNGSDMIIRSVPRRDFMQFISIYSINTMAIIFAIIIHSIAITASVSLLFIDSWLTTINVSQLSDLRIRNLHSKAMHASGLLNTHIHTCKPTQAHTGTDTYTHMHTRTYIYTHIHTHTHMHTQMHTHIAP